VAASEQGPAIVISSWEVIGFLAVVLWLLARRVHRRGREALNRLLEAEQEQQRDRLRSPSPRCRPGYLSAYEPGLPAACIPAPPSARPSLHVPSACRHEKILPVITQDGDHVRWVCANPRCKAEFPASVAVYEEPAS
jgi:hypothetical protein